MKKVTPSIPKDVDDTVRLWNHECTSSYSKKKKQTKDPNCRGGNVTGISDASWRNSVEKLIGLASNASKCGILPRSIQSLSQSLAVTTVMLKSVN